MATLSSVQPCDCVGDPKMFSRWIQNLGASIASFLLVYLTVPSCKSDLSSPHDQLIVASWAESVQIDTLNRAPADNVTVHVTPPYVFGLKKSAHDNCSNKIWCKAYVINREVDEGRREAFFKYARAAKVHVDIFHAVDKNTMDLTALRRDHEIGETAFKRYNETGNLGGLACTLSHNRLWRMLASEESHKRFLIFEDDAAPPRDFYQRLKKAMGHVPSDWDLLYFDHDMLLGETVNGYWLRPDTVYPGAHTNALLTGYMTHPEGLRRILRIQHPIDWKWSNDDNLRRHFADYQAYFLLDRLVPHSGVPSVRNYIDNATRQPNHSRLRRSKPAGSKGGKGSK